MMKGTITKITDRGFGFIKPDGQEKDLFFHAKEVNGEFNSLQEGDVVSFEMAEGPKGPNAVNVTVEGASEGASAEDDMQEAA